MQKSLQEIINTAEITTRNHFTPAPAAIKLSRVDSCFVSFVATDGTKTNGARGGTIQKSKRCKKQLIIVRSSLF